MLVVLVSFGGVQVMRHTSTRWSGISFYLPCQPWNHQMQRHKATWQRVCIARLQCTLVQSRQEGLLLSARQQPCSSPHNPPSLHLSACHGPLQCHTLLVGGTTLVFIVCFQEFLAARGQTDAQLYSEVADHLRDEAKWGIRLPIKWSFPHPWWCDVPCLLLYCCLISGYIS